MVQLRVYLDEGNERPWHNSCHFIWGDDLLAVLRVLVSATSSPILALNSSGVSLQGSRNVAFDFAMRNLNVEIAVS